MFTEDELSLCAALRVVVKNREKDRRYKGKNREKAYWPPVPNRARNRGRVRESRHSMDKGSLERTPDPRRPLDSPLAPRLLCGIKADYDGRNKHTSTTATATRDTATSTTARSTKTAAKSRDSATSTAT